MNTPRMGRAAIFEKAFELERQLSANSAELDRLHDHAEQLAEALHGVDTVYAEYAMLRPDPNTRAFELVTEAVQKARAALAAWERHNETTKGDDRAKTDV